MYQRVCSLVLLYLCTHVCFFIWFENRIIKWIEIMWSIKPNLNPRLLMSFSFIIALLGIIVISIMLWFLGFSALAFSPDILYFMLLFNLTLLWSDFFFFFFLAPVFPLETRLGVVADLQMGGVSLGFLLLSGGRMPAICPVPVVTVPIHLWLNVLNEVGFNVEQL